MPSKTTATAIAIATTTSWIFTTPLHLPEQGPSSARGGRKARLRRHPSVAPPSAMGRKQAGSAQSHVASSLSSPFMNLAVSRRKGNCLHIVRAGLFARRHNNSTRFRRHAQLRLQARESRERGALLKAQRPLHHVFAILMRNLTELRKIFKDGDAAERGGVPGATWATGARTRQARPSRGAWERVPPGVRGNAPLPGCGGAHRGAQVSGGCFLWRSAHTSVAA